MIEVIAILAFLAQGAGGSSTEVMPDNSHILYCFLKEAERVNGVPKNPGSGEYALFAVQLDSGSPADGPSTRTHDPLNLYEQATISRVVSQGREAIRFVGLRPNDDGGRSMVFTVAFAPSEQGLFPASINTVDADGSSDRSRPFYAGECIWNRPEGGSNIMFQEIQSSEPTVMRGEP